MKMFRHVLNLCKFRNSQTQSLILPNKTSVALFQMAALLFFLDAHGQVRERLMLTGQLNTPNGSLQQQLDAYLGERFLLDSDGNTLLSVGVQYRKSWVGSTSQGTPTQLQMVVPTLTTVHSLNERWTLVAQLRVGAFGDLKNFGIQDMRIEGALFFDRVYSDTLTIGYGAARSSNFGRVLYVPLLHVLKNFGDQFLLDALLPSRIDFWYFPSTDWEIGFNAAINGSRYRISESLTGIQSIGLAEVNFGPAVRHQFAPQMWLGLETGMGVARRFNLYTSSSTDDAAFELSPISSAYARLNYTWRF
jgi:hypothetical protein